MMQTIDQIVERLEGSDPAEQIGAMADATAALERVAKAAVATLDRGPHRFLIAERLHSLGSILAPYLEELLQKTANEEARILSAVVLLQLGSLVGVPVLLKAVERNEEYAALGAAHLARARVHSALPVIIARLRATPLENVDLSVSLLLALKELGAAIPLDLAEELKREGVPWQIRTLL